MQSSVGGARFSRSPRIGVRPGGSRQRGLWVVGKACKLARQGHG